MAGAANRDAISRQSADLDGGAFRSPDGRGGGATRCRTVATDRAPRGSRDPLATGAGRRPRGHRSSPTTCRRAGSATSGRRPAGGCRDRRPAPSGASVGRVPRRTDTCGRGGRATRADDGHRLRDSRQRSRPGDARGGGLSGATLPESSPQSWPSSLTPNIRRSPTRVRHAPSLVHVDGTALLHLVALSVQLMMRMTARTSRES